MLLLPVNPILTSINGHVNVKVMLVEVTTEVEITLFAIVKKN